MRHLNKSNIFLAGIFFLMIFVGMKIFRMEFPITNFDNLVFSMATAKNIDISKAILWYMAYAVPICFLFAWLFEKSFLYDKAKNFFAQLEVKKDEKTLFLMIVLLSFLILCEHNTVTLIFAAGFALISLFGRNDEVSVTAWLSSIYIFAVPIFCLSQYVRHPENVFLIFIAVTSIYFCLAKNFSKIFARLYPFLIAGISSLILLTVLEILLVRGFTVSEKILFVPYIFAAAAGIFLKTNPEKNYEQKILRGSIILIMLSAVPILGNAQWPADFFEGSNHGLSIQEFVQYGELPLISNFDAHMLFHTLSGLIWFGLTGDYIGAMFSPYTNMIQVMIGVPSFFYLFTKFLPERQAFILVVFFPLLITTLILPGLIVLPTFIFWKRNPNFFRSLIVQITISALCLYRIDLGVSFGFALFAVPILFCLLKKNYKSLREYIFAAVLWASTFFAVVFFVLNFEFAEEFFTAFNSNQHWALGDLGETKRVIFLYFIMPAIMAILFLPVARRILDKSETENDWIILFLYLTFIFGIQRIIVRHTYAEMNPDPLKFILIALLIVNFCKAYKAVVFSGIWFVILAIFMHLNHISVISSLASTAAAVTSVHSQQHQYFAEFNENDQTQMDLMKKFFDENLHEDETYFDFTNLSLFFAITNRKNPVYINQCPAMINSVKKGQLLALGDLEKSKSKIKFVTMPYTSIPYLDGILNCDRYYLLSEWIYKNFQPYQPLGYLFIWKLKDNVSTESLNYNYEPAEYHIHNLGYIPQLLGKSSVQSEIIELPAAGNGLYNLKNVIGKAGFISMEISSDSDEEIQFKIKGNAVNDVVYRFQITEGTHVYRFRVSSEMLWHSGKLETLDVENLPVNKIYFEEINK